MVNRIKENQELVDSVPHRLSGTMEDVARKLEAYKLQALIDISKSLAIIASDKDIAVEADAYVHDHMLIEFIISCIESGTPYGIDTEEWYGAWKKRLKELEERSNG